jgi:hypothetical protein
MSSEQLRVPQARFDALKKDLADTLERLRKSGTRPVRTVDIPNLVARILGYPAFSAFKADKSPPVPIDHLLEPFEVDARRRKQAAALMEAGLPEDVAAAVIEVILPTGDRKIEARLATMFGDAHVRELGYLPDPVAFEAAWQMHSHGGKPADKGRHERIAAVRVALDGGIVTATRKTNQEISDETGDKQDRYCVVVAEPRRFWQGMFVRPPSAEVIQACEARVSMALRSDETDFLMAAVARPGGRTPPDRLHALEEALVDEMTPPIDDMMMAGGFAWLISETTGYKRFAVTLDRDTGDGARTSVRDLKVPTIQAAREAVDRSPAVARIKAAMIRDMGMGARRH